MKAHSRERVDELRRLPLEAVAQALGYKRSQSDRAKRASSDSIVSINHARFYDHLSQTGGGGAIETVKVFCPPRIVGVCGVV